MSVEKEVNAEGHDGFAAEAGSENPLATLSEEQAVGLQLDKIKRMTVEPGLIRLPVQEVSSTEESNTVTVECHHPAEENPTFHLPKPTFWDAEEEALPKLMGWYGYRGSNYHKLQTDRLFLSDGRHKGRSIESEKEIEDWEIVPPPEWSPPRWERFKKSVKRKTRALRRPSLIMVAFFLVQLAVISGAFILLFGASTLGAIAYGGGFTLFSLWLYGVAVAFKESV